MMLQSVDNLSGEVSALGVSITGEAVALSLLVLLGAAAVNIISNRLICRSIEGRNGDKHAIATAKKLSAYVIFSFAVVAILGIFGVPLSALGASVGLIGLGLSFALKDVIANFISGLLILVSKPFKIGDQIETGGEEGTVKDIRIRATDIKTYDGRKVIVPNSILYNDVVINNTGYDERRFEVVVGIGYDEDIEEAKELAMETLEEAGGVEEEPEPQVLVTELGGSSVDLKLRGWTKPSKANMVNSASEVTQLVKEKYDEAGIDIPYPIRTVFMEE